MPTTASCGGEEMSAADRCAVSRNGYQVGGGNDAEGELASDRLEHGVYVGLAAFFIFIVVYSVTVNAALRWRQRRTEHGSALNA